jgi:hypothetical protein
MADQAYIKFFGVIGNLATHILAWYEVCMILLDRQWLVTVQTEISHVHLEAPRRLDIGNMQQTKHHTIRNVIFSQPLPSHSLSLFQICYNKKAIHPFITIFLVLD